MINLKYSIKAESIGDNSLQVKVNELGRYQAIRNYPSIDGIRLVSEDTNLISNAFKRDKKDYFLTEAKNGYVYKQIPVDNLSNGLDEFDSTDVSSLALKDFFIKFGQFITGKVSDNLPDNISIFDEIRVVEITDTSIRKLLESEYSLELNFGKVFVEDSIPTTNLFVLLFKDNKGIKKVDNNFDISDDKLLSLDSGFYQILPKYYKNSSKLLVSRVNNKLSISSDDPSELVSDLYLNIDNFITNRFFLLPSIDTSITYNQDYTPLNEVSEFVESKEYIIFQLEGSKYIPKFYLSSDNEEEPEDFTTLMKSHYEFKRAYVVLANKANLLKVDNDLEEEEIKTLLKDSDEVYTIENSYFKTVLEKHKNLIKVKI